MIQSHSLLTAVIRRKVNGRRPSRFDSSRFAISSPLKLGHLKYPQYYDPILTSSFASPVVRNSLRGGTAPTRYSVGGGGEKNRVPRSQPALGGKTACRVDRCRGGLFAPKQERPRDIRRPCALREALAHRRQRGHQN